MLSYFFVGLTNLCDCNALIPYTQVELFASVPFAD